MVNEKELAVIAQMMEQQSAFIKRVAEQEDVEQFNALFSEIYGLLEAHKPLTDHQWESLQRLYYCQRGTFLIDDIKQTLGY